MRSTRSTFIILLFSFLLAAGCGKQGDSTQTAQIRMASVEDEMMIAAAAAGTPLTVAQARSLEARLVQLINEYRAGQGMGELIFDAKICDIARAHSSLMANGVLPMGHDGFTDRVQQISSFISVRESGENVAMNQGRTLPLEEALKQWQNSPKHNHNMLNPWGDGVIGQGHTGIGIAKGNQGALYFTQIFVGGTKSP